MDTTRMQEKLQEELKTVTRELSELGQKNPSTGEWETDGRNIDHSATEPDEIADRFEDFEERQDEIHGLEARRNDILAALEKIAAGTYGVCDVCGKQIEDTRLEVNPAARTCTVHS